MILCITPNVAIDRTLLVPAFSKGGISRATETIVAAGGKGINVARAIKVLGEPFICADYFHAAALSLSFLIVPME